MTNGNGRSTFWQILLGVLILVVGLVVGYYANEAKVRKEFVTMEQYNIDQARSDRWRERMEDKIDHILDKVDPLYRYRQEHP